MKLFISVDLEGMAGVTFWKEIGAEGENTNYYKKIITTQINYVCRSLFERFESLKQITICDSHSSGDNYLYDKLPDNVVLIKGFPRKYYMMEGLDSSYDGVIFLGYHVGIGRIGNMDHTYSSSVIYDLKINDNRMNEFLINSFFAGDKNVPVIMASGGNRFVEHVNKYYPGIETIVTKNEIGKFAAKMENLKSIENKFINKISGFEKLQKYPVVKPSLPLRCKIDLTNTKFAEVASLIPTVSRTEGRRIEFSCDSMVKFYETLMAIIFCSNGIKK